MREKLKSLLLEDKTFYGLLVILMSIISFGLGYQSGARAGAKSVTPGPPEIVYHPATRVEESIPGSNEPTLAIQASTTSAVVVVASRAGSRYHLPDCPGALQIKPENRITFASVAAAEAAGYTPAANCPGLK